MAILNLTQHAASAEQIKAGVVDVSEDQKARLRELLTFNSIPTPDEIRERASCLAELAENGGFEAAMIGGAPYLMSALEVALKERGIQPMYAFSKRESVEKVIDGKTVKTAIFRHLGFVEV